mmetsp:Transcript_17101/g.54772  ORF Transcript_17101/g.54772 Transcript_17101/m.54772 type:complete len:1163 (-) Transcript_17101:214-3702(-)
MELLQRSECDVSFREGDVVGLSLEISSCLETKGFCVVDPGLSEEDLQKAREEVEKADNDDKLHRPPELVVEGLLGAEGSARTMDLDIPESENYSTPPGLSKLDAAMTETAAIINETVSGLGFTCPTRTVGVVNETGMTGEEAPEMGLEEASTWMTTFMRHRLMIILCLGPIQGTLELTPFDDEAEVYEVSTRPGTMIVLRADAMSHRHFAQSKALMLTCFLLESKPAGKLMRAMQEFQMVPVAKEIYDWTVTKMKEIKEQEYEYKQPANIPNAWLVAMNHMFSTVQRIAVRGVCGRFPSSFKVNDWYKGTVGGPDLVTEVPMARWRVEDTYDPDPDCWRWGKVFTKHGGFMDGADLFEPKFFGLSLSEAKGMDPHQRIVLEVGYEAAWMAGYKKGKMMNSLGGMYLGSSCTIFGMVAEVSGATGGAASINSNRFSFCLGMKGPSMTVDTEGSSGMAAIYLASEATLDKGRGTVNAFSLAGGVSLQLGTIWWPQLQSAGLLSKQGRCLTFDQAAEGYCLSDCCSMTCLKRLTETVGGEQVYIEGEPLVGTLAGASMNSNGLNAKMNAPNGPAEQELIAEAVRIAMIAPVNVDAVECHGQGAYMADAVEVDSLARVLRGIDIDEPLALTSSKTLQGHGHEAAGTVGFLRALLANAWGTVTPNIHLKQVNPHMEPEAKVAFSTETLEYPLHASYTGAMAHGFGGTNVCTILLGECDPCRLTKIPEEFNRGYITFWPGGGGELDDEMTPHRAYYIAGSWSGWVPESMQNEGDGSYGFTATLGENRWEDFQILLDGDKHKCLHPQTPMAHKGAAVNGPDHGVRGLNWRITGTAGYLAPVPGLQSIEGGSEASAGPDLKVVSVGTSDRGEVGDQYRVHLQVAGKYRSVSWEKLGSVGPSDVPVGEYYITSSWNGWALEKLSQDGDTWSQEVHLLRDGGEFQIVRNKDWGQVFCSDQPYSESSSSCTGPQDIATARGYTWYLNGQAGDVYKISFERRADEKKISWEKLRSEPLTQEQERMARRPVITVVGSWSGWLLQGELTWDGHDMSSRMPWAGPNTAATLSFFVEIGPDGEESFQFLQDGDWNKIIHPFRPVEGSANSLCSVLTSPNTGESSRLVWIIGPSDGAQPGQIFKVTVSTAGHRVAQVLWAPAAGDELDEAVNAGAVLKA